jgi:hypothetical protein
MRGRMSGGISRTGRVGEGQEGDQGQGKVERTSTLLVGGRDFSLYTTQGREFSVVYNTQHIFFSFKYIFNCIFLIVHHRNFSWEVM